MPVVYYADIYSVTDSNSENESPFNSMTLRMGQLEFQTQSRASLIQVQKSLPN